MKKLFIFFLITVVLCLSCKTSDDLTSHYENTETTQTEVPDTARPEEPDKLCALTFDDGPDPNLTSRVLDKLENYRIVATFFVVGRRIDSTTRPVLERIVSMGCEIGNHSYGYASMDTMSYEHIVESVRKTDSLVEEYAGVTTRFFRPPNLAVSDLMYDAIDLPFAVGGVVAYDWQGGGGDTPEKIAASVINNVVDGVIILLHDVQPLPHPTPEALDSIIPALKNMGYEFITLSDLFDKKGVDPGVGNKMWTVVR